MKIYFALFQGSRVLLNHFACSLSRRFLAVAIIYKIEILALSFLALTISSKAATWYVDSSVAVSGNGTSWANAWKGISNITGVSAGDVVYISGGASGNTQTYAMTSPWSPVGGVAGNPITYQIGQDAMHNGTAYFSGTNAYWISTGNKNFIISGDAGDGKMHFTIADPSTGISPYTSEAIYISGGMINVRISYINFGKIGTVMDINPCTGPLEIDHTFGYCTATGGDHWGFFPGNNNTTWDTIKIHDNTIYVPHATPGTGRDGFGSDGIQISGSFSVYNNTIIGYNASYTGGQHQDGLQTLGGAYEKVYNNYIAGMANYDLFFEGWASFSHLRVYNNICAGPASAAIACGESGNNSANPCSATFNDVVICNNLSADAGGIGINNVMAACDIYTNCLLANNILVNASINTQNNPTTPTIDNVSLTSSQAASMFVNYSGGDYHLSAQAGALILQGTNLFAYFTTDKDGNIRPSSGSWDIGPYLYGVSAITNPATSLPTVSVITVNASDVSQGQGGLQIYGGTVVTLSATATNALTYRWSYSVNGGSSVPFQAGSGTVPSVSFSYGTNVIGNSYVWTLSVSNSQGSAQSQLTLSVVSPPPISSGLSLSAESGQLTSPFIVGMTVAGASTNYYVYQPVQTTGVTNGGSAIYYFTITNAGNYEVQALVNAPNTGANSLYVNIDAMPQDPNMIWDVLTTSGFEERLVSWRGNGTDTANQYVPWIFPLTVGQHWIVFSGREANTQLSNFSILPAPPTPPPPSIIGP